MGKIGDTLRGNRVTKGLTLSQVEDETKIRSKYLEALETEDFQLIPGRVYVKGFLRTYATFLGVNANELLGEYDKLTVESKIKTEEQMPSRKTDKRKKKNKTVAFQWNPEWNKYAAIVAAILVLSLFNKFYPWGTSDTGERTPIQPQTSENQQEKNPDPKKAEPPAKREPVKPPVVFEGVDLQLTLKEGDSWMLVQSDGTTIFEGIAKSGEVKTFSGDEKVFVRLGNAGAVEVTFNGEKIGFLGAKGSVVSKEFVKEKINNPENRE